MASPSAAIARSWGAAAATLPTGATHIWDASLLSYADGTVLSGSTSQWTDTGSSPTNLNTAITAYPTFYKTTSANLINGHPAVFFDGAHAISTGVQITQAQPFTIAIILQPTEAISSTIYYLMTSTTAALECVSVSNQFTLYAGSANLSNGTYDLNSHLTVWVCNAASSQLVIDGSSASGSPGAAGYANEIVYVGAEGNSTHFFKGLIGFVAMWPRAFSAGDLTAMHSYSQTNWGTP